MKKNSLNRVGRHISVWEFPGCVFFVCTAMLATLSACTARKHVLADNSAITWSKADDQVRTVFFTRLADQQLRFETLNARGKGLLTINQKDQHEVNVQLRMEADRIWVSVTAMLGMEVGRVLLTPDSVLVINRLDGTYWARPFPDLHRYVGETLSFENLQQLLAGNVSRDYFQEKPGDQLSLSPIGMYRLGRDRGLSGADLYLDAAGRMQRWLVRDMGPRTFEVNHVYQAGHFPVAFPRKTTISVESGLLVLLATMDYSRLVLDQPVAMPFSIPKGYRQLD